MQKLFLVLACLGVIAMGVMLFIFSVQQHLVQYPLGFTAPFAAGFLVATGVIHLVKTTDQ